MGEWERDENSIKVSFREQFNVWLTLDLEEIGVMALEAPRPV